MTTDTHNQHHVTDVERQQMLHVLSVHVGRRNGISVKALAERLPFSERHCRHIISDLREEGFSICGTPATGYFIAANAEELGECCDFLRRRAMHSLRLESRLRNLALPDLIDQLRFTEA